MVKGQPFGAYLSHLAADAEEDNDEKSDARQAPRQHYVKQRIVRDMAVSLKKRRLIVLQTVAEEQQVGVVYDLVKIKALNGYAVGGDGVYVDGVAVFLLNTAHGFADKVGERGAEQRRETNAYHQHTPDKAVFASDIFEKVIRIKPIIVKR